MSDGRARVIADLSVSEVFCIPVSRAPLVGRVGCCVSDVWPVIGPGFGGAEGLRSLRVVRANVVVSDVVFLNTW